MAAGAAPPVKRLVNIVPRGPRDNIFYPTDSQKTLFNRTWPTYHNMVPDIVELDYRGNATWGQRITVQLKYRNAGDLVQWICLRFQPRSWLGADVENKLLSGNWDYKPWNSQPGGDPAWMWTNALASAAIKQVELEFGDALIETWGGEWLDVWSRIWLDAGRSGVWDRDLYATLPPWEMPDAERPSWTTFRPTPDGYVYCWLPLAFMRRPNTAFPLVAVGEQQEIRINIQFRNFSDVVRRRSYPRASPTEVPLGETIVLYDNTGETPIPWEFKLPTQEPGFEEFSVLAGVVQTEDPLRSSYMHVPFEMLYESVNHSVTTIPSEIIATSSMVAPAVVNIPLLTLNGPLRELVWFIRRKNATWQYNDWTNYGGLAEPDLINTLVVLNNPMRSTLDGESKVFQQPLIQSARLMVNNAVWREDSEQWWRLSYGNGHRGGVRLTDAMIYGIVFSEGSDWTAETQQPLGTINASQVNLRLDLFIQRPENDPYDDCTQGEWEVHVFAVSFNWMRFVSGQAVPLFRD